MPSMPDTKLNSAGGVQVTTYSSACMLIFLLLRVGTDEC